MEYPINGDIFEVSGYDQSEITKKIDDHKELDVKEY